MRSHSERNCAETLAANFCGEQTGLLGGALDFLSVLVGTGQEPGVKAQRALAAADGIRDHRGIGVAEVRPRIHVIDRCCQVELR